MGCAMTWESLGASAIAFAPDNTIYVTQPWNQRIVRYDADGNEMNSWTGQQITEQYPLHSLGIDADGDGYVYAGNYLLSRVEKYTFDGYCSRRSDSNSSATRAAWRSTGLISASTSSTTA